VERIVTAGVPIPVIGVPFRRGEGASSALVVSFSFIHPNVMPIDGTFGFPLDGKML
jgi:hypothetical protein